MKLPATFGKEDSRQVVASSPHFLVLEQLLGTRESSLDEGKIVQKYTVTSLMDFDGRTFPRSGFFVRAGTAHQRRFDYEFRNLRITKLLAQESDSGAPNWPSGTAVRYKDGRAMTLVPHSPQAVMEQTLMETQTIKQPQD